MSADNAYQLKRSTFKSRFGRKQQKPEAHFHLPTINKSPELTLSALMRKVETTYVREKKKEILRMNKNPPKIRMHEMNSRQSLSYLGPSVSPNNNKSFKDVSANKLPPSSIFSIDEDLDNESNNTLSPNKLGKDELIVVEPRYHTRNSRIDGISPTTDFSPQVDSQISQGYGISSQEFQTSSQELKSPGMYNRRDDRPPSPLTPNSPEQILQQPSNLLKSRFSHKRSDSEGNLMAHRKLQPLNPGRSSLFRSRKPNAPTVLHPSSNEIIASLGSTSNLGSGSKTSIDEVEKQPQVNLLDTPKMRRSSIYGEEGRKRVEALRKDSRFKEEWSRFHSEASTPLITKEQIYQETDYDDKPYHEIKKMQKVNDVAFYMSGEYYDEIKKEKELFERLGLLEKLGFDTQEKTEQVLLMPVFKQMKYKKEPKGTMTVVDLWSKAEHIDMLNRCGFEKGKDIIRKLTLLKQNQETGRQKKKVAEMKDKKRSKYVKKAVNMDRIRQRLERAFESDISPLLNQTAEDKSPVSPQQSSPASPVAAKRKGSQVNLPPLKKYDLDTSNFKRGSRTQNVSPSSDNSDHMVDVAVIFHDLNMLEEENKKDIKKLDQFSNLFGRLDYHSKIIGQQKDDRRIKAWLKD